MGRFIKDSIHLCKLCTIHISSLILKKFQSDSLPPTPKKREINPSAVSASLDGRLCS
jgi:hypothetical protein